MSASQVGYKLSFKYVMNNGSVRTGSEFRALLAEALKVNESNDYQFLFNYGEDKCPLHAVTQFKFGVNQLLSIGEQASEWLSHNMFKICAALKAHIGSEVILSLASQYISCDRMSDGFKTYTATNMVIIKHARQAQAFLKMGEADKKEFVNNKLRGALDRQCNAYGLSMDVNAFFVTRLSDDTCPILIKRGKRGQPYWGLAIKRVTFIAPYHLTGAWSAGLLASRGCGNINFYRPQLNEPSATVSTQDAASMLEALGVD